MLKHDHARRFLSAEGGAERLLEQEDIAEGSLRISIDAFAIIFHFRDIPATCFCRRCTGQYEARLRAAWERVERPAGDQYQRVRCARYFEAAHAHRCLHATMPELSASLICQYRTYIRLVNG